MCRSTDVYGSQGYLFRLPYSHRDESTSLKQESLDPSLSCIFLLIASAVKFSRVDPILLVQFNERAF